MDYGAVLRVKRCEVERDKWGYHKYEQVGKVHKLKNKFISEIKAEMSKLEADEKVRRYKSLMESIDELRAIDSGYNLPK